MADIPKTSIQSKGSVCDHIPSQAYIPRKTLSEVHSKFHEMYQQVGQTSPQHQPLLADLAKTALQWDITQPAIQLSEEQAKVSFSRFQAQLWFMNNSLITQLGTADPNAAGKYHLKCTADVRVCEGFRVFKDRLEEQVGHAIAAEATHARQ